MTAGTRETPTAKDLIALLRETLVQRAEDPAEILVHHRVLPARAPVFATLAEKLPPSLARALVAGGIRQLYAHQVAAIQARRAGQNVVLVSPTASGKTLSFAIPTIERFLLQPRRVALYVYPTKALIADQRRALDALLARLPPGTPRPRVGVLTGDTPHAERDALRADPPAILLASPDVLHHAVLAGHGRWQAVLARLDTLVLDEIHTYRGVFGAHIALVVRRLLRMAARYGAQPTLMAASATIGNPVELAEALAGRAFARVDGESGAAAARHVLFWRPPLVGLAEENQHRSTTREAAAIFGALIGAGRSGILFGRSRVSVERMLLEARDLLSPAVAQRVSAYKAGYRPEERARIEAGLRDGSLRGVVATNALELGIDVGQLDVCVLAGHPGSLSSFWQMAGRVGRRADRDALIVLVAADDALDSYYLAHPERFFAEPMEQAVVDPSSPTILLRHLLCAAREAPITAAELDGLPASSEALLERLAREELLVGRDPWAAPRGAQPHREVSLRGIGGQPYALLAGQDEVGSLEPAAIVREAYPGAVYLHNGRAFRVQAVEHAGRTIRLAPVESTLRTDPRGLATVEPVREPLASRAVRTDEQPLQVCLGRVRVREETSAFVERRGGSARTLPVEPPVVHTLETLACWVEVPVALEPDAASVHACEHALANTLPVAVLTDRRDVGSASSVEPSGVRRLYLYDRYEGGVGIAERVYHLADTLLGAARDLLRDCPCASGCPSCVHLPGCATGNQDLDKEGGLALLSGGSPRVRRDARRLLRRADHRLPAPVPFDERSRRLARIADEALRERLGQPAPPRPPVVVGDLVQVAGRGLAHVRAVGPERVEVVLLLGDGAATSVPPGDVRPL